MAIKTSSFGKTVNGESVTLYQLINKNGFEADIIDYGACLVNLYVPDNNGRIRDVVLGFDDITGYENNLPSFGAVIGRNCNRIAGGRFELEGKTFQLMLNDGNNNLHSGFEGYHLRMWNAFATEGESGQSLKLTLRSADGDQGFPGRLYVTVIYLLTDDGLLHITYYGVSDKDTIVNMTNHSYFNMNGHNSGNAEGHRLWINALNYTPTNDELIPTGEIKSVKDTAFDFTSEKTIGQDIGKDEADLILGGGYDHNFVLENPDNYRKVATLTGDVSGISMEVHTDQPGIQLYTANFLDGTIQGKDSTYYQKRSGVCLETQNFPDAVNHSNFPNSIIKGGEMYLSRTTFKFINES